MKVRALRKVSYLTNSGKKVHRKGETFWCEDWVLRTQLKGKVEVLK